MKGLVAVGAITWQRAHGNVLPLLKYPHMRVNSFPSLHHPTCGCILLALGFKRTGKSSENYKVRVPRLVIPPTRYVQTYQGPYPQATQ